MKKIFLATNFHNNVRRKFILSLIPVAFIAVSALSLNCSSDHTASHTQRPDELASHIDKSVNPGDDFFHYANGTWFKEHPIPASEASNGIWQIKQDTTNAQIRSICESAAAMKNPKEGSNKQKIGDFFYTGMDSVSLNQKGISGLKNDLDRIDAIQNLKELAQEAAYIYTVSGAPLYDFYVTQDDKKSSKYAVNIWQGGLSLPDRRYYFDTDKRAEDIRRQFVKHLAKPCFIRL